MGIFERYLSIWVGAAIIFGIVTGNLFPEFFIFFAGIEFAHVNMVIAALIWIMIYPMMVQIDFSKVKDVGKNPQGIILTIVINWLVKPFSMAMLGYVFFKVLYSGFVDYKDADQYIAGMILLGVAPCTAMVFVWSQLTKGNANYTLVQVSINDIIMIFAFVPITSLLLGINDIHIPWQTLFISVLLYVVLPLLAGAFTRRLLNKKQETNAISDFLIKIKPYSISGLILTVVILFGFQAEKVIDQPLVIVLISIPLLIQTYGVFFISYFIAKRMRLKHDIAAPACMISTSNFFELAVAVAISIFGLNSGAALATVVGVLVEVPVMLSLVAFANRTKHWF